MQTDFCPQRKCNSAILWSYDTVTISNTKDVMLFMEKYYPQVLKTLEISAYLGLLNVNVICRLVSSIQRFYGSQMGF